MSNIQDDIKPETITAQTNVQIREKKTQSYLPVIFKSIPYTINKSDFNLKKGEKVEKHIGKVRDRYNTGEEVFLVTTDRLTAFDRKVTEIPFKGAVLNLVSKYWFEKTAHIMPNHLKSIPHPNITIAKAVKPIPIEFVVRDYLTGSTGTSILTNYNKGVRKYCGVDLPEGLVPHQKLLETIVTPSTKSDEHDELISPQEIIAKGIMTQAEWDYCSSKAIELFKFASAQAAQHGLILVDTKMEMGRTADGKIILIDELFTPDSSRFWLKEEYNKDFANGYAKDEAPKSIDKEHIRKWISKQCNPYLKDVQMPVVPAEMIAELSRRYILLYELITGLDFDFKTVINALNIDSGIKENLQKALVSKPKVGIIMGSDSDLATMKEAAIELEKLGIAYEITLVSAHRTPKRLMEYASTAAERGLQVIIAGAGGAAHLPGMTASMTTLPVIGVPVVPKTAGYLNGIDALHSIVQMPKGVPVATVAIGGAANAGLLAVRILAANDPVLRQQLANSQEQMRAEVEAKASKLEAIGWEQYLAAKPAEALTPFATARKKSVNQSTEAELVKENIAPIQNKGPALKS